MSNVSVLIRIAQAHIDTAVKRNVRSDGGTGKSAENSKSSKSLLHF